MTETFSLRTARESDRIALRGVRLRGRVAGMTGHMVAEQTFVNLEPRVIEAVYTFPLPEDAAVCGFEIIFGDRVLTGAIEEKEKAIEKYEDALADGDGAYMVEQRIRGLVGQTAAGKLDRIIPTLLAMFLLAQRFADRRRAWKRAWNKARSFVAGSAGVTPDEVERWLGELAIS